MIKLLARFFIKDNKNVTDNEVRGKYGTLCSVVGIVLNLFLFVGKYIVGTISGSIAIVADGMNSLSDAGSSLVSLVGFRLAGKKPDPQHPYGHGRIEYISGLVVSFLILHMGFDLLTDSIKRIVNPEAVESSIVVWIVLTLSIAVKVYISLYNYSIGKKIDSATMKATAFDSLSDVISTSVVLGCNIAAKFFAFPLDGYCGALVSLLVLYAGFSAVKETVGPLLGQPPKKELVDKIEEIVLSHEEILGIHDLVVHDYGPGRLMITLHAEVPGDHDIFEMHDLIDNIEGDLNAILKCEATIHMDPIDVKDTNRSYYLNLIKDCLAEIDEKLSFHDFRIVPGQTHTNLVFDVVTPAGYKMDDLELRKTLQEKVSMKNEMIFVVIKVDRDYVQILDK